MDVMIRQMTQQDIEAVVAIFAGWHKTYAQFERYLTEQTQNKRTVLVALRDDEVVGYVTVVWQTGYAHFRVNAIPEIVDLNVITPYQRQGIGTALIHACERLVAVRSYPVIGISVVMDDPDYAAARRLYPALGYKPDGHGVTPEDSELHLLKTLEETGP